MSVKKTLISSLILERFMDNYSETEYKNAWDKLQHFLTENKDNPDLYRESAFDAEWLDAMFCDILGYPKKLKSREFYPESGSKKQKERIDGVFYHQHGPSVKMVIELKALDTPDLFKKDGQLSPITQGAKYLFQTPKSELAVVSNFDQVVIFDRKEEFRQSWSLFDMTFEQFKEFYLILSFNSFYGNLTRLMIDQSETSEKDVDEDFYSLAASIHRSLHNKLKPEYASDLFNKFIAMSVLEDSGRLPARLIRTVFNRKTDFDQSLKSHWEVFCEFFKTMKNNKASREYLKITEDVASLPVWQDISYLGRVKVPKNILDQVLALSEYNLKSVPLNELFFNIAKRIYNPYDGVAFMQDATETPFTFYNSLLMNSEYAPIEVCLGFAAGKTSNINHPFIQLYNQLTNYPIREATGGVPFSMCIDYVGDVKWYSIVEQIDLEDENVVKTIKKYIHTVDSCEIDGEDYALLSFFSEPAPVVYVLQQGEIHTVERTNIKSRIHVLTPEEKQWLETYLTHVVPFSELGKVVTDPKDAWFRVNLVTGAIVEKDEFGDWQEEEILYESNEPRVYVESKFENLPLILSSNDFTKYLHLMDSSDLQHSMIATYLLEDEFIVRAKAKKQLRETIALYEYNLDKLKNSDGDELDIMRIDKKLDELYAKQLVM